MINKVASSEIFDLYARRMISKRAAPSLSAGRDLVSEAIRALNGIKEEIAAVTSASTASAIPEAVKVISRAKPDEARVIFEVLNEAGSVPKSAKDILSRASTYGYTGAYDDVIEQFSKEFGEMAKDMEKMTPATTEAEVLVFYNKHKKALDFYAALKGRDGTKILTEAAEATKFAVKAAEAKTATEEAEAIAEAKAAKSAGPGGTALKAVTNVASGVGALGTVAIVAGTGYLMYSINQNGIPATIAKIFGFSKNEKSIAELSAVKEAIDCINNINIGAGTPTALARIEVLKNLDEFLYYQQLEKNVEDRQAALNIKKANDAGTILVAGPEQKGSISNFLDLLDKHPEDLRGVTSVAGGFISSKVYSSEIECIKNALDNITAFYTRLGELKDEGSTEGGTNADSSGSGQSAATDDVNVLAKILSAMTKTNLNRDGFPGIELVDESRIISGMIRGEGSAEALAQFILDRDNYNIKTYLSKVSESDKASVINSRFINTYSELISEVYAQLQLMNRERKMNKNSKSINNQQLIRNAAETKVSYFEDAKLGLKDQLTKSYYAGLTGMYNEKPQKRASDYKDLYGTQKETGEDLMIQSHPKSITLAESMGKGGLVENNLEQQQKSIYVATTTPSGNFQSKYAQTINYLEKLSKAADNQGKKEVSRIINQTIKHLK